MSDLQIARGADDPVTQNRSESAEPEPGPAQPSAASAAVAAFGTGLNLLNFTGRRALPLIRQSEAAECGLACLAMVAGYHGQRIGLAKLRQRFPISLRGMTLAQLMQVSDELGLHSRPLRGEIEEMPEVRLPAVLHWDLNHFVVLKAIRRRFSGTRYIIHDPARGVMEIGEAELSKHWTGVVLELYPTQALGQMGKPVRLRLSQLGVNIGGLNSSMMQAIGLSLLLQLIAFAAPFFLQLSIDKAVPAFDTNFLLALALGFAALELVGFATRGLRELILLKVSSAVGFAMTTDLFRHLLRLPIGYFERRNTGDIISRFESTEPINDLMSKGLVSATIDAIMALLTFAIMFYYSPVLTLVAMATLGVFVAFRFATYRRLRNATTDYIAARADEASTMIETVRGMSTIKLFGRLGERMTLWQNKHADTVNAGIRMGRTNAWTDVAGQTLMRLETVLFVYLAISMVIAGSFTVGMVFAYQAYKNQFLDAGLRFVDMMFDYRMLDTHVDRLADIALEKPEDTRGTGSRTGRAPLRGEITLRQVRFAYGKDDPEIVRGVDLVIPPGDSLAITGPSGGGKSTLLKLIMGLYAPTSGQILIDGEPLSRVGVDNFRRLFATVMQDDVLYAGSVAENIAFFDPDMDLEFVLHCAQLACIHDEIAAFPMGYDTLVGEMGASFSGGQKQRLFLARALYHRPKILLLDEGTANLDQSKEAEVNANLAALNITRIMVAHRPETIASAGRVVEMRDGVLRPVGEVHSLPPLPPVMGMISGLKLSA